MDDLELVGRARGGDRRAYGALVERHQTRIHATLARITGDPELAMDLTQDAFIRAWQRLDGFQGRAAFSTWLYRIAVRLAYDERARGRGRTRVDLHEGIADEGVPSAEERMESADEAAELRRRIGTLPDMQRAVVVLRAWDRLPYREIAEILETTEASARVSFHYGIRRLREQMTEAKA